MLQGFYIFVIFVCKRNVINTILGKVPKKGSGTSKTTPNEIIAMTSLIDNKNISSTQPKVVSCHQDDSEHM
jgi:hypothetical protein